MDLRPVANRVAAGGLTPESCSCLVSLLALLRAAFLLHQTHHWQTTGEPYYGDHLMLQRFYEGSGEGDSPADMIDSLAEKIVGYGGVIPPAEFIEVMAGYIKNFAAPSLDPEAMLMSSLEIEKTIILAVTKARETLEAAGNLSDGFDNLLQGIADGHETFIYLAQQRLTTTR